jgi:hypothetical protein
LPQLLCCLEAIDAWWHPHVDESDWIRVFLICPLDHLLYGIFTATAEVDCSDPDDVSGRRLGITKKFGRQCRHLIVFGRSELLQNVPVGIQHCLLVIDNKQARF